MIKAVLFDLDGTLLPMELEIFTKQYMGALANAAAVGAGRDPKEFLRALNAGIVAMAMNDGGRTNEEVFWQAYTAHLGADARKDEPILARFYENEYRALQSVCGYAPEASEIVEGLYARGIPLALATNSVFPPVAIRERLRWAGVRPEAFAHITTYDNSHYTKPNPAYYKEIADTLGIAPECCLMVGNDTGDDLPAARAGMQVFLLHNWLVNPKGIDPSAYPGGGYPELSAYLDQI